MVDKPLRVVAHGEWSQAHGSKPHRNQADWGCAEARGVVYMYYLLCRYLVLLVLTHAQREAEELTTLCGFGFVSCWEIYAYMCISCGDGGLRCRGVCSPHGSL